MKKILSLIVVAVMLVLIPIGAWYIWDNYQQLNFSSDPQKRLEKILKEAEAGDAEAQYQLALGYHYGQMGLSVDRRQSFKWYKKAAEHGHVEAQNSVGVSYELGEGVDPDSNQAVEWYAKAIENNHSEALRNLSGFYYRQKDYKNARIWLAKAAEQGDVVAQSSLGYMYEHGQGGAIDMQKALKYYKLAAQKGDAAAQFNLGDYFRSEEGGKDYQKAFDLYRKASENGLPEAYYHLANMYNEGAGVEKDLLKAGALYKKAADMGIQQSQKFLDQLEGVCKRASSAQDTHSVAACVVLAPTGDAEAQYKTAIAYQVGVVVPKDLDASYEWLERSASQGHKEAEYLLNFLKEKSNDSPDTKTNLEDMTLGDFINLR